MLRGMRSQELFDEGLAKLQLLAFLEEHCRNVTLHEVRDWYAEAFMDTAAECR